MSPSSDARIPPRIARVPGARHECAVGIRLGSSLHPCVLPITGAALRKLFAYPSSRSGIFLSATCRAGCQPIDSAESHSLPLPFTGTATIAGAHLICVPGSAVFTGTHRRQRPWGLPAPDLPAHARAARSIDRRAVPENGASYRNCRCQTGPETRAAAPSAGGKSLARRSRLDRL